MRQINYYALDSSFLIIGLQIIFFVLLFIVSSSLSYFIYLVIDFLNSIVAKNRYWTLLSLAKEKYHFILLLLNSNLMHMKTNSLTILVSGFKYLYPQITFLLWNKIYFSQNFQSYLLVTKLFCSNYYHILHILKILYCLLPSSNYLS